MATKLKCACVLFQEMGVPHEKKGGQDFFLQFLTKKLERKISESSSLITSKTFSHGAHPFPECGHMRISV